LPTPVDPGFIEDRSNTKLPIYEYRCESCAFELEKLQKMSDDMLVDCPECGQPALKRLISAVAFRLKGSGWYETDFKQDNKRNLADSSDSDTSDKDTSDKKSSGSDSKKTDKSSDSIASKPDTKPAVKPAAKEAKHA
jgi:putative FmdB family regulatory protein